MALQGVNVACGYARLAPAGAVMGSLVWSRQVLSGQVTDLSRLKRIENAAQKYKSTLCFEVTTDRDIWVAYGVNPDASVGGDDDRARILVRAGETRNVFCDVGDRLAVFDA